MSGTSSPRGHVRNISSDVRRVAMPRRTTKGPLDIDEDPAPTPPTPTERPRPPFTPALQTDLPPSPGPGSRPDLINPSTLLSPDSITSYDSPTTPQAKRTSRSPSPNLVRPQLDLTPLLRPGLYNPIPTTGIPPPFLHSPNQPSPDISLPALLSYGHLRHAADKAADLLSSSEISPLDITTILSLFHTRLACLVLLSHAEIAAKEARALLDILARESGAAFSQPGSRATSRERVVAVAGTLAEGKRVNPVSFVPWDLRLLLERLKTVLSNDRRRGIMALYQLGSECRHQAFVADRTGDVETRRVWEERLYDLGLRVASELVEMGEFETAGRHLRTLEKGVRGELSSSGGGGGEEAKMAVRRGLLYLRVGDVEAAEKCYAQVADKTREVVMLKALHRMAEGDYAAAVEMLQQIHTAHPEDELVRHNLAISLLYTGDATSALQLLEGVVDGDAETELSGKAFSGLLFNLATVYELRTERARDKKVLLVERVAGILPDDGSIYEHVGKDFKL